jgi:hypothetical protein
VYIALHQVLSKSYNYRLVLLTATPIYDNPKEIFELSNLLNIGSDTSQFPIRNDLLKGSYVTRKQSEYINNNILKGGIIQVTQDGLQKLSQTLNGKVSYLKENTDTNPRRIDIGVPLSNRKGSFNVVLCEMSDYQYDVYLKALKIDINASGNVDIANSIQDLDAGDNINENNSSVQRSSSLYKNSSDAATMSYPNGNFGKIGFLDVFTKTEGGWKLAPDYKDILTTDLQKYSSKMFNLINNIKQTPGNVFVYSNYVSYGGTSLIKQVLLSNGFTEYKSRKQTPNSFIMFDDSTNIETREKYKRIFNHPDNKDGKYIKIIIGSPLISEGITLKNVRQVHILEPSWNMSRINQIIGRAIRNHSHDALDIKDRDVSIFKYISVNKDKPKTFFIDREKYILSEEKDRSNKQVERLLKEISFDCDIHKNRNHIDNSFDNTAECDYTVCDISCKVKRNTEKPVDRTTYNMYINTFEKHDLNLTMKILQELFKEYYIWSLEDIKKRIRKVEPSISDETIYTLLNHVIQNKIQFNDIYNRPGFIITRGQYYIFNNSDIDVNSSMYSRMFDFTVDKTKYTLNNYVAMKHKLQLVEEKKAKTVNYEVLSDKDIEYNNAIISKHQVFGTFRKRGAKNNFGPKDTKFRIVDMRDQKLSQEDKRKNISGMWIGSFKRDALINIAKYLKIKTKNPINEYDKEELGQLIQSHLSKHNLILR